MAQGQGPANKLVVEAQQGWYSLLAGDYDEAIRTCDAVISQDPEIMIALLTGAVAKRRRLREQPAQAPTASNELGYRVAEINREKPGRRASVGIFEKDDPRSALCAHLKAIGLQVQFGAVRKRTEGATEWEVELTGSPIRYVLIRGTMKHVPAAPAVSEFDSDSAASVYARTEIVYLVPDARIPSHVRGYQGVGADTDRQCWELKGPSWTDHEVTALLTMPRIVDSLINAAPTREQWLGYEGIARALLGVPIRMMSLKASLQLTTYDTDPWDYLLEFALALRRLGLESRPVERERDAYGTTEVEVQAEPVRSLAAESSEFDRQQFLVSCYIPDHRLSNASLNGSVVPVKVRSFPLVGTVMAIRWKPKVDWPSSEAERTFSSRIAEHLGRSARLVEAVRTASVLRIDALPEEASWVIKASHLWKRPERTDRQEPVVEFDTLWWDFEVLAKSLLEMPIPFGHREGN